MACPPRSAHRDRSTPTDPVPRLSILVADQGAGDDRGDLTALVQLAAALDGVELITVSASGTADPPAEDDVISAPHRSDSGDSLADAARRATAARCLVLYSGTVPLDDEIRAHADAPVDALSSVAPPPVVTAGRATAANFLLARTRGVGVPTALLRTSDALCRTLAADGFGADAATAIDALAACAQTTITPRGAWDADDVCRMGGDAMRLYRAAPRTLDQTGLGAFRLVAFPRYLRRRAVLALPITLARRLSESARHDAEFWRGVRAECSSEEWASLRSATSILMYHAFDPTGGTRYVVGRRRFRTHLRLLRLLRRRVLSLDDYAATRREHRLVPARASVITIDDGYADAYEIAAPELRRAGIRATLFVPSAHAGGRADWTNEPSLAGRPLATWEQMSDRSAPIDIGSHSAHHVAFDTLDEDCIDAELAESAATIERSTGRSVDSFAYPYGAESELARERIHRSPYSIVCTSHGGLNTLADPLTSLRRVEIRGDDRWWRFVAAVTRGSSRPLRALRSASRS